jgi:hypothetical protein
MRSFKHPNDLRTDPKFRAIEKKLGEAGYARALKLFEVAADKGSKAGKFVPALDLKAAYTDIDWLAAELRISVDDLKGTLDAFATVELIDPEDWRNQVVRIPQMKNYLDEYTQRQLRSKKSRQSTERVPSHFGHTPDTIQSVSGHSPVQGRDAGEETAIARESQKKKDAAIAADLALKRKMEGCWKPLGIAPCGRDEFQEIWKSVWEGRSESEPVSDVMRRCIEICNQEQVEVQVPRAFHDAKREAESREFDEEVGPYLGAELLR